MNALPEMSGAPVIPPRAPRCCLRRPDTPGSAEPPRRGAEPIDVHNPKYGNILRCLEPGLIAIAGVGKPHAFPSLAQFQE
jgi:hypothetical protein